MAHSRAIIPTKGNLMSLKKSLSLANKGYELMDRKRNILVREVMSMMEEVRQLRDKLEATYHAAYRALQEANITLGAISDIAQSIPLDNGLSKSLRSVMGVELPTVSYQKQPLRLSYGIASTNTKFDFAFQSFIKARDLTVRLAEVENSLYRLANGIRKAQKRANALRNVAIPDFEAQIKFISDSLEEKEREEFTRLKLLKTKLFDND